MARGFPAWTIPALALAGQACVKERCYHDSDCPADQVCGAAGRCVFECVGESDCGEGFECKNHQCVAKEPVTVVTCPEDMVVVAGAFCADRHEASRPDANATSEGSDATRATSRPGVIPWLVPDNATAQVACEAAGKRLCTPAEWELACRGPAGMVYGYGDDYDPETCNGIETFGPGKFHLMPTGSFPNCTNGWGVFDMNGNVWEHVLGGDDRVVRGGAFNCSDSRTFQRCDYVPRTWTPAALGFRCCLRPSDEGTPEAPPEPVPDVPEVSEDLTADPGEEVGCVTADEGDARSDRIPEDPGSEADASAEATDPGVDRGPDADDSRDPGPAAEVDVGSKDMGPGEVHPGECPDDMVPVNWGTGQRSCMDRYEASHQDATDMSKGTSPVAASRPGVLPWFPVTLAEATAACEVAGKRLCKVLEWLDACRGPDQTVYSYGNDYNATICNGIDTFCHCDPYPHCYPVCGAAFHVEPTGSFPDCTNEWGVFDINGNVWELVDAGDGQEHFRGGAFNCSDSEALHRCDYDATWGPSARGFRCCKDLP